MARQSSSELRRHLAALAANQAGYFTAGQALSVGYSHQSQKYHSDSGNWRKIDRGLYRLPEWPTGAWDDLVRWTLWSDGVAVVSHESALSVHELGDFNPAFTHMTVPPDFTRTTPGVVLHHAALESGDITDHAGFAVTTPLRSLIDVASQPAAAVELLAGAIHEALEGGVLTRRMLRARADDLDVRAALNVERALLEVPE